MTSYSSLTDTQREQVRFLFCDDLFGTKPESYEYELTGETVTRRKAVISKQSPVHARKPRKVKTMMQVIEIADADHSAEAVIKDMARRVVARLIQIQPQEA